MKINEVYNILDNLNDVTDGNYMFIYDIDKRVLKWTKATVDYFGFSEKEIKNMSLVDSLFATSEYLKAFQNEALLLLNHKKRAIHQFLVLRDAFGGLVSCTCKVHLVEENKISKFFVGKITVYDQDEYDDITELSNSNQLIKAIDRNNDDNKEYSVYAYEFKDFHNVNIQYGYEFANKILKVASSRVNNLVLKYGELYRAEGTFFVVLLNKSYSLEEIYIIDEEIRAVLTNMPVEDKIINLEINTGARIETCNVDAHTLLSSLISTISKAKNEANFDMAIYDEGLEVKEKEKLVLFDVIKANIIDGCNGFYLCYQPFVNSNNGLVIGAEALLRFKCTEFGFVPPNEFIPMIETHPLFYDLGLWIIKQSLLDTMDILKQNPEFFININLSFSQIERQEFVGDVLEIVDGIGYPHQNIQFELTERCWRLEEDYLLEKAVAIKEHGFMLALDDFGKGSSTISLLCKLPVNCVKIDQSYVLNILGNRHNQILVETVTQCAKKLGVHVCMEGVENKPIKDFIASYDADYYQGYHYERPIVIEEFMKIINKKYDDNDLTLIKNTDRGSIEINDIISTLPGGFFTYLNNEEERILTINERVLKIFECETVEEFKQLTNNSFKGVVHPDDYDRVEREIYSQIKSNNNYDYTIYRIITKTGKVKKIKDFGHLVKREYGDDLFYVFIGEELK